MKAKRSLYLGYYLKQLDREKFRLFLAHVVNTTGIPKSVVIRDIIRSVYKYNISILEYFQFRFYELGDKARKQWAGTGFMYEYQLAMNPKNQRHILDDKRLFYKHYSDFFVHKVADIAELRSNPSIAETILSNPSGKLVFKQANGKCGAQVTIRSCEDFDRQRMITFMVNSNYDLVEEFIEQHAELNKLSPSAVNTIRIFTQLNEHGDLEILGCRLRISVNSPVDNMAAGNLAAPIDEKTGQVFGSGVYSDVTKPEQDVHPITNIQIKGFQIPFWEETIQMVKKAALLHPQNKSVGWDIVMTELGPGLIEGNHDWCKLLWQLPVKKGLKPMLEEFTELTIV